MIKFWMLVVLLILCLIGIAIFLMLLFDDYVAKLFLEKDKEIERLKDDKKKVLELIENDYFEDGSFKNYYEVLNTLKGDK